MLRTQSSPFTVLRQALMDTGWSPINKWMLKRVVNKNQQTFASIFVKGWVCFKWIKNGTLNLPDALQLISVHERKQCEKSIHVCARREGNIKDTYFWSIMIFNFSCEVESGNTVYRWLKNPTKIQDNKTF